MHKGRADLAFCAQKPSPRAFTSQAVAVCEHSMIVQNLYSSSTVPVIKQIYEAKVKTKVHCMNSSFSGSKHNKAYKTKKIVYEIVGGLTLFHTCNQCRIAVLRYICTGTYLFCPFTSIPGTGYMKEESGN